MRTLARAGFCSLLLLFALSVPLAALAAAPSGPTVATFLGGPAGQPGRSAARFDIYTFCVGHDGSYRIGFRNGPRNTTITYQVSQTTNGVLGFSWSAGGPFTQTLDVPIALDGNGNGTSDWFVYRALRLGTSSIKACAAGYGCFEDENVYHINAVTAITFEDLDRPLDANPNAGGGKRMFPERKPFAGVDGRRVRVAASLLLPTAGVGVSFRSFDPDDPSSDAPPVDPNGSAGGDNRGREGAGNLGSPWAQTGADGVARTTLQLTLQPGDNFKVAATCSDGSSLDGITVDGTDLRDAGGSLLPTSQAGASDLLTVWRRVHVEIDSMGLVSGNEVTGSVVKASPNVDRKQTALQVDRTLEVGPVGNGRFQGGRLTLSGAGSFPVILHTRNVLLVEGLLLDAAVAGRPFVLVDDDDFNDDDGGTPDGDRGENVTAPDISLLEDSDDPARNVFAPAYVRPIYDVGDDNDFVPFVANETGWTPADLVPTYDFDAIDTEGYDLYWTVYLLGAYQHTTDRDNDPAGESTKGVVLGVVDRINGMGGSIFNEVLRSREVKISAVINSATVAAHEIGHLFNGEHADGGLMASTVASRSFSEKTLAKIRSLDHP
jgi:hypothetical protein